MKKPIERSRLLRSLFFPHPAVVAVCVPADAALLAATFLVWGENHPIAYLVYPFSAYALVVLCTGVVPLGRAAFARVQRIPLVGRLLRDLPFRARAALYASLGVNLVRYRRYNSPVLTASRAVSLAAALVSMLSLEVAMLAAFSTEEQAAFSTGMIAGSGFGVCAVVAGLGTAMWVQANRALRRSPATTPRR